MAIFYLAIDGGHNVSWEPANFTQSTVVLTINKATKNLEWKAANSISSDTHETLEWSNNVGFEDLFWFG